MNTLYDQTESPLGGIHYTQTDVLYHDFAKLGLHSVKCAWILDDLNQEYIIEKESVELPYIHVFGESHAWNEQTDQ